MSVENILDPICLEFIPSTNFNLLKSLTLPLITYTFLFITILSNLICSKGLADTFSNAESYHLNSCAYIGINLLDPVYHVLLFLTVFLK